MKLQIVSLLTLASVAVVTPAYAGIKEIDVGYTSTHQQTAPATLNFIGSYFASRLQMDTPGEYASATMSYNATSKALTAQPGAPDTLIYQTGYYPSPAALVADFPAGAYDFATTDAVATLTVDTMPSTPTPEFANFADFSTIAANQAFAFDLTAGFTSSPPVTSAFTFLTLYDATANAFVYDAGFALPSTTSFLVSGDKFIAGHSYSVEAIFSNRIDGIDRVNDAFTTQLYDSRTFATFTVASVPEPGAWALMILGFGAAGAGLRRRRRVALTA